MTAQEARGMSVKFLAGGLHVQMTIGVLLEIVAQLAELNEKLQPVGVKR
jgi:hypothetical protein